MLFRVNENESQSSILKILTMHRTGYVIIKLWSSWRVFLTSQDSWALIGWLNKVDLLYTLNLKFAYICLEVILGKGNQYH